MTRAPFTSRSLLSVPGSQPDRVRKAWACGADQVVVDLEDSVPPEGKAEARAGLAPMLDGLDRATPHPIGLTVRVNAIGTPWFVDDLLAVVTSDAATAVMLPKTESARDLHALEVILDSAEQSRARTHPLGVLALVETAAGLARVLEIASGSARLLAVVLGYADLTASLGRRARESGCGPIWVPVQSAVVAAARAAGVAAVDGPWLGVADDNAFRDAVAASADLGFDATWVIHPRQVETANRLHRPTANDIARAERVVDALASARAAGAGAAQLDGQMLDEAVARWAEGVLTRAVS